MFFKKYGIHFLRMFTAVKLAHNFIENLSVMIFKKHIHTTYPFVYLLVELALVLPVVIATVERVFSAIKTIKTYHRNRMGDA